MNLYLNIRMFGLLIAGGNLEKSVLSMMPDIGISLGYLKDF